MSYRGKDGELKDLMRMCRRMSVRCYLNCKAPQRNCGIDPKTREKVFP
jgi:hypothetical protein